MHALTSVDTHALALLPFSESPAILAFFLALTHLGDTRVILTVALALAIVLWRRGKHSYWYGLAVSLSGASFTAWFIKLAAARPRPLEPLIEVAGYSLPSMHATAAVALYGYLIYVTRDLMHPPHHRLPWTITLLGFIALVGLSRIYLGVHYPTDVIAGFLLGGFFLWIGIRFERRFRATPRREG